MPDLSFTPVPIGQFRSGLKGFYGAATKGQVPVPVAPAHDDDVAILISADMLVAGTAEERFHPTVHSDGDQLSVWLPELEIYGIGDTAEEAEQDLLEEVVQYVDEYYSEGYHLAPNRRRHLPYVLRAYAAHVQGQLREVIFESATAAVAS